MAALTGHRICVTRSRAQGQELEDRLTKAGAEVVWCPLLQVLPPGDPEPLDQALDVLASFDWVVFSSRNGVEQTSQAWQARGRPGSWPRCAVVGSGTAIAARDYELEPAIIPEQMDADGLVAALAPQLTTASRVLLPQADNARHVLRDGLAATGAAVVAVEAYRGIAVTYEQPPVNLASCSAITFASSATVRRFAAIPGIPKTWPAPIAIGQQTAVTLTRMGQPPIAVALEPTMAALVDAVVAGLDSR